VPAGQRQRDRVVVFRDLGHELEAVFRGLQLGVGDAAAGGLDAPETGHHHRAARAVAPGEGTAGSVHGEGQPSGQTEIQDQETSLCVLAGRALHREPLLQPFRRAHVALGDAGRVRVLHGFSGGPGLQGGEGHQRVARADGAKLLLQPPGGGVRELADLETVGGERGLQVLPLVPCRVPIAGRGQRLPAPPVDRGQGGGGGAPQEEASNKKSSPGPVGHDASPLMLREVRTQRALECARGHVRPPLGHFNRDRGFGMEAKKSPGRRTGPGWSEAGG
jgi:hypothetical protein